MHPIRAELNRSTGTKISGRQWRKYRKLHGFMTTKIARRFEGTKKRRWAYLTRQEQLDRIAARSKH